MRFPRERGGGQQQGTDSNTETTISNHRAEQRPKQQRPPRNLLEASDVRLVPENRVTNRSLYASVLLLVGNDGNTCLEQYCEDFSFLHVFQ